MWIERIVTSSERTRSTCSQFEQGDSRKAAKAQRTRKSNTFFAPSSAPLRLCARILPRAELKMTQDQALLKTNGNGLATVSVPEVPKQSAPVQPLTQEMVDEILAGRGLRGWLRAARVARVLGLFSLYLFLDTYDIRADFNNRAVARKQELARGQGRKARLQAWINGQVYIALDRFIRALRYLVFRGAEGSAKKQARLEQQALWLRQSLIDLGPTFIKIGQALGTRADLLPLEYVKELAKLQDQVPAFPTAEAFAIIEAELGRSVHEAYAEIDSEPIAAASLGQV